MRRPAVATAARAVALGGLVALGATLAATRAAVWLHEVGGHLGAARLFGGRPAYLRVELLGGGRASSRFPAPPGALADLAVDLGGIAIQAAAGAVSLVVLRHRAPAGAADLALRVFAAAGVIGAIHYLVAGGYYGHGDPEDVPWLWIPALALALPASDLVLRPCAAWVAARVGPGVAQFGGVAAIAGAGYLALFSVLERGGEPFAAVAARSVAIERAIEKARDEKIERLAREQGRRPARREDVEVAPSEVQKPFPIEVPLAIAYLAGAGLAAARAARPGPDPAPGEAGAGAPVALVPVRAADAVAALALGGLALLFVWPLARGARLG